MDTFTKQMPIKSSLNIWFLKYKKVYKDPQTLEELKQIIKVL